MNACNEAEKIRSLFWSDVFPVDPVTIAKGLGVEVLETSLPKDVSGVLIKKPGEDPKIVLERTDSISRKRFSCGHELGHFISRVESNNLEQSYDYVDFRDQNASNGTDPEEIYANQFAACLLMPESKVKELYSQKKGRIEMAYIFDVSNDAMKYRLSKLGLL